MVGTPGPGYCCPVYTPATGRRSGGTQGQLWWVPLVLGTAAPSTLLPQVGGAVAPRGSCGGYRCSWVLLPRLHSCHRSEERTHPGAAVVGTAAPGYCCPVYTPATGRRSDGTQGQLWWVPLLLGTAAPSTLLPQVGGAEAPRGSCGGYCCSWVLLPRLHSCHR